MSLRLNVGQRIESKHMPVECFIESNNSEVKRSDNRKRILKSEKVHWDEEEQIALPDVLNFIREATDLTDLHINESLLNFLQVMQKDGPCMKMTITIGNGESTGVV